MLCGGECGSQQRPGMGRCGGSLVFSGRDSEIMRAASLIWHTAQLVVS